jgi:hypothetical protein
MRWQNEGEMECGTNLPSLGSSHRLECCASQEETGISFELLAASTCCWLIGVRATLQVVKALLQANSGHAPSCPSSSLLVTTTYPIGNITAGILLHRCYIGCRLPRFSCLCSLSCMYRIRQSTFTKNSYGEILRHPRKDRHVSWSELEVKLLLS